MKSRTSSFVLIALLTSVASAPTAVAAQERGEGPRLTDAHADDRTANVRLMVSAEDRAAIPAGSKIQWEGTGDGCRTDPIEQSLRPKDATPLTLPVCKVKLTIFITGFATKAVTVDLVGNEKKYDDPIHIRVRLQGLPEVSWVHEGE
jgi:hypothetical protein